jgi:diaminohydroxyphosphoribosylaminopyrimidine deaminase/5-amino-6-(5-phosphoribosylamino)uracil reductase
MREALALAQSPDAPHGENPRVGCVLVAPGGEVVGRGYHRGAGTPHAEVVALADAGPRAAGATAVVTLEPCRHTGRTGPCTRALIDAGVRTVVYAQSDPTDDAGGGGDVLRAAGVEVHGGVLSDDAAAVNEEWTFAVVHGRPFVTWKCAVSLDGRVAGADGGPTAITGAAARNDVHDLRARVGAIIVGTGTVLTDDPLLTVRRPGEEVATPPLRVVAGSRPLPEGARVLDDSAPTLIMAERDPHALLADLYRRGVRHALLEGGPTLAAAFLAAGAVDRVEWYVAPVILGAGPVALPAPIPGADPLGVDVIAVDVVGEDVRVIGRVRYEEAGA